MVQIINNNNLGDAASREVAVVDFSAAWCGPCQMLAPVYHELAEEMANDIAFYAADVDKNMELAQSFDVSAVPTIIILKNGKEIARSMGFQPKEELRSWIQSSR